LVAAVVDLLPEPAVAAVALAVYYLEHLLLRHVQQHIMSL
jgi:hypothetical protein